VLLSGRAKSLLRLHRGAEMMAVPIRLPADPEYDLEEVPARDRTAAFEPERRYLQREADAADGPFALAVYALVAVLVAGWVVSFGMAVSRIGRRPRTETGGGHPPPPVGAGTAGGAEVGSSR
jgi:hypothetical protein